ncbi:MAG TPA: sulfite exporter TauE/SafE family protein [Solirubrobacteraceae bacterium]|nr:sulfite exporter TauE/SafE family protein [Solirubrobacteraceae bacterium]
MHVDLLIVLGAAIVGLLVGMTGAGGGALMTPMLILLFSVKPSTAISSDLVAAVLMRPIGAAVHMRAGTVNYRLVRWMVLGSVPAAFAGAWMLKLLGNSKGAQSNVERVLGAALLIGACAMALRFLLDRRGGNARMGSVASVQVRPLPTLVVGIVGGLVVGMTSVGSGSLMIVFLLFLYPSLSAKRLVGTDLTQAVPLTLAAALGALVFGHVSFGLTLSLILGSVPAVFVGSLLSSRVPDRFIRPVIGVVIMASGLKYIGASTSTIGWAALIAAAVVVGYWLVSARPASRAAARSARGGASEGIAVAVPSSE